MLLEHVGRKIEDGIKAFRGPYLQLCLAGLAILSLTAPIASPAANPRHPATVGTGLSHSPALPETVPGRQLRALIFTFNRGDSMLLRALIAESFEESSRDRTIPATRAEDLRRLFDMTGDRDRRADAGKYAFQ